MPNLTVQAADTATAMEEIWEKLGPDAMIVSTSKRNGRIVMEATTDNAKPAVAPSVKAGFSDVFTGHMIAKPGSAPTGASAIKSSGTPTAGTPDNSRHPALNGAGAADIAALRREITAMKDMMSGLVLTDLDGVNPSLSASTKLELQRAGFSATILNQLKSNYAGLDYNEGCDAFLGGLAERLAHPKAEKLLSNRLIFVVGASGTGRTTMVAKLIAMLRDAHPKKEIIAATLHGKTATTNQSLQSFGRLLNVPVCALSLDTPVTDFNKMTDYDIMVIDVTAMPDEASEKIAAIKAHVGSKDVGIIATIPGSTSRTMIELTLQRFDALAPMIALTKLDECETTASEFSAYAEADARISLLSGTKSVIGASIFASENILLQYLNENFSKHDTVMPTSSGAE
jgi:flagellar biosynthesis GTPase FlhF